MNSHRRLPTFSELKNKHLGAGDCLKTKSKRLTRIGTKKQRHTNHIFGLYFFRRQDDTVGFVPLDSTINLETLVGWLLSDYWSWPLPGRGDHIIF